MRMVCDENDYTLGPVGRQPIDHFDHCVLMVDKLVIAPHVENELFINHGTGLDECLHKLEQQLCWGASAIHRFKHEMQYQKVISADLGLRSHLKLPLNFNGMISPGGTREGSRGNTFPPCSNGGNT